MIHSEQLIGLSQRGSRAVTRALKLVFNVVFGIDSIRSLIHQGLELIANEHPRGPDRRLEVSHESNLFIKEI